MSHALRHWKTGRQLLLLTLLLALVGCNIVLVHQDGRRETLSSGSTSGTIYQFEDEDHWPPADPSQRRAAGSPTARQELARRVPAAAFLGHRNVLIGSVDGTLGNPIGAGYLRQSDCSLTTWLVDSRQRSAGPVIAKLPDTERFLADVAGIDAVRKPFTKGCRDDRVGLVSMPIAYLGRTDSKRYVGALIDIERKLTAFQTTASGVITDDSTLATGTAETFSSADLNGDGIADLVLPYQDGSSRGAGMAVFLSRDTGRYRSPTIFPVTGNRYYAASSIADVNGDGDPDIVVLSGTDLFTTTLTTFLGNGRGGFRAGPVRSNAGSFGRFVVADLDGDGLPDVLRSDGALLKGAGDGSFGAPQAGALPTVIALDALALGDFDGDGHTDVAATSAPAGGFVLTFRGNGRGTFRAGSAYAAVGGASNLAVTDLDGDGHADLVVGVSSGRGGFVSEPAAGTLTQFLFGLGNGRFVGAQAWPSPSLAGALSSAAPAVAMGDVTGDGRADLLMPTPRALSSSQPTGTGTLTLRAGSKSGTLGAAREIAIGGPAALAVGLGDVDGDGQRDAIYAGRDRVAVVRGLGGGRFGTENAQTLQGGDPLALIVADFNGDGRSDAAVLVSGLGVMVTFGQPDGSLSTPGLVASGTTFSAIAAARLRGTVRADLLVGESDADGGVRQYAGRADGTFAAPRTLGSGGPVQSIALGDLNGDGDVDLVVAAANDAGSVRLLTRLGQGDGRFAATRVTTLDDASFGIVPSMTIADYNRDGKADVAYAQDGIVRIGIGAGNGRFVAHSALAIAQHAQGLASGDADGDRQPDLAVVANLTGVALLLNRVKQWR